MKKIYVLIGTMEANEATEKLENGKMCRKSEVAYNEKEMKEITKWYGQYYCLKWLEVNTEEELKEREIYTWRNKKGEVRYSQNKKYAFKKVMEALYGNMGYDD